jgi:hypothetical protein
MPFANPILTRMFSDSRCRSDLLIAKAASTIEKRKFQASRGQANAFPAM